MHKNYNGNYMPACGQHIHNLYSIIISIIIMSQSKFKLDHFSIHYKVEMKQNYLKYNVNIKRDIVIHVHVCTS